MSNHSTSAKYALILTAMRDKDQVLATYRGHPREFCPHTIGHTNGQARVLGFQFAGQSSRGLPPSGEWRCFNIDELQDVTTQPGEWQTGISHRRRQSCIDDVVFEVFA